MVEDNKISLNDQIKEKQMLGRGLFGRTFSGDRNGYKCAKKIIDISELTQDQKISICTELKAMEQVKSEAAFYLPPQDFEIDELSKVLVITSELECRYIYIYIYIYKYSGDTGSNNPGEEGEINRGIRADVSAGELCKRTYNSPCKWNNSQKPESRQYSEISNWNLYDSRCLSREFDVLKEFQ